MKKIKSKAELDKQLEMLTQTFSGNTLSKGNIADNMINHLIEERYCSPEVSKLLKEKGFDIPVWTRYEDDDEVIFGDKYNWNNSPIGQISAPTQSMVMDWLRIVHNICIAIYPDKAKRYEAVLYDIKDNVEIILQIFGIYGVHIFGDSYEEACDVAIKYCLEKLI